MWIITLGASIQVHQSVRNFHTLSFACKGPYYVGENHLLVWFIRAPTYGVSQMPVRDCKKFQKAFKTTKQIKD